MLRKLVLTNQKCVETDFSSRPWNDVSLVTPRHGVRRCWNEAAVQQHATESRHIVFTAEAEDTIKGQPLTLEQRYAAASRHAVKGFGKEDKDGLLESVDMAIGMKVMVTRNVETDLDITNGARGTIVDILLHPEEPVITMLEPRIHLKHLPLCLLVKLDRTRATQLNLLEEGVVPVEPARHTYRIQCRSTENRVVTRTVRRRQFPTTAAYAFTDYRSQGQTLSAVVVDIASPPTAGLNLFNLYVALS